MKKDKERAGRKILRKQDRSFGPYDLEGAVQEDIGLIRLTLEHNAGNGSYIMRMDPGAKTRAHVHDGMEDFMILDGELIDDDGTVFGAGDFISYAPGTEHNSWTETGCVILVCEWGKPA
jgi:anti-sigma factor ChrR (cupin superfamily)